MIESNGHGLCFRFAKPKVCRLEEDAQFMAKQIGGRAFLCPHCNSWHISLKKEPPKVRKTDVKV